MTAAEERQLLNSVTAISENIKVLAELVKDLP